MIKFAKNIVENFDAIEIVIEKNYYSHDTRSYQFKKLPVKVADSAEEGFSATIIVRMRNSIQLKKNYKYFVALDKPNSRAGGLRVHRKGGDTRKYQKHAE